MDNQLRCDLESIAQLLDDRVEVWRVVYAADGHVVRRIYSGSFHRPLDSRSDAIKNHQEDRS